MRTSLSTLFVGALAALIPLVAAPAAAATNPCGNIELLAINSCEIRIEGGCKADCTPLNFQAACDGQCNVTLQTSCTAECNTGCSAQCEAMPAMFNCEASCKADCAARVVSQCDAGDEECQTYGQVDCNANCESNCSVVPPEAQCSAGCEAACNGSCETDANFDCSLQCSADLKGGCEANCDAPQGALFCDGQFINPTSLDECLAYLGSNFGIQFGGQGEVDAGVESPPQMEMEEDKTSCTTTPAPGSTSFDVGALATMAAGVGLVVSRRRRRS